MDSIRKNESPDDRKKRFKRLSSDERKRLIREKLKKLGLKEGSGVSGKNQSPYDKDEIMNLILLTKCFKNNK